MLCVPGIPKVKAISSSSSALTTRAAPPTFISGRLRALRKERIRVDRRPLPPFLPGRKAIDGEVKVRRVRRRVARRPDEPDRIASLQHLPLREPRRVAVEMRVVEAERLARVVLIDGEPA